MLSSTDIMGKLASIPVVVQAVNASIKAPTTRKIIDNILDIHAERELPEYTAKKFRPNAKINESFPVKDGENSPGKVAIFSTCYVNYNEPGIGHDLIEILKYNEIPTRLVENEVCCGMPKLELGDLEAVEKLKNVNIPNLVKLAREGYAIIMSVPSCALMFKQELPLLFPNDKNIKLVAEATFDPFEYLILRKRDGLLNTDFKKSLGKVSYHIPCHLRVQNIGKKTKDMLEMIPGTTVNVVERCSGHDGTWGVKSEYFADSMKIGKPVFRKVVEFDPDYISSDCAIAGRHIYQGIGKSVGVKQHPLTLLRIAYGLT
jgi:Fe-S oxidoreductase